MEACAVVVIDRGLGVGEVYMFGGVAVGCGGVCLVGVDRSVGDVSGCVSVRDIS